MCLKRDMRVFVKRLAELVKNHPDRDRTHLEVSSQLCDEFDLWQKVTPTNWSGILEGDKYEVPMWVMHLVSSEMHSDSCVT